MRVVVAGATGFLGQRLCAALNERGHRVVVLARDIVRAMRQVPHCAEYVAWQQGRDTWMDAIEDADAVVNLAGAPIAGWPLLGPRWTTGYKRQLHDSRIGTTRALVAAIERASRRPEIFIGGSATGYYGFRGDEVLDESGEAGTDFLARLCVEWEAAAREAEPLGLRVVRVRTGIVLARQGGSLPVMALPVQWFGLAGAIGSGRQWLPWVHLEDWTRLMILALEDDRVQGPLNATAPEPVRNRDFYRELGRMLSRPAFLPVPGFVLRLVVGEAAQILTTGQRAVPSRALALGFQFRFPQLSTALEAIYARRPTAAPTAAAAHH